MNLNPLPSLEKYVPGGFPFVHPSFLRRLYRFRVIGLILVGLLQVQTSYGQSKMTEGFENTGLNHTNSKPFNLDGSNDATITNKYSRGGSRSVKSEILLSPAVPNPRSEIQHKGYTGSPKFVQPEHKFFTTRTFGFSFYFPSDFQDYDPLDESLMQWKNIPTDACNIGFPGFSIRLRGGDLSYNIKYGASACKGKPKTKAGTLSKKIKKGVWHNFVVEIHNDYREKGGNGYVKVWYNEGGEIDKKKDLRVNYKGAVGYKADEGPFLKLGMYKSLWKNKVMREISKRAGVTTREMYIDDVFIIEGSYDGTSTGSNPPKYDPPTVNAGKDITISLPTNSVTIDGSGSSKAGIDKYFWEKVSGPNATIDKPNKSQLVAENLKQGNYVFRLTVTAKDGQKASDEVKVTVKAKAVTYDPPTADAGKDLTITLPKNSVTIDGSGSSQAGIDKYFWQKVSGPNATIDKPNKAQLLAEKLKEGNYVFRLTVTANDGQKASDEVKVTVKAKAVTYDPPTANAGKDLTITLPKNSVSINGSGYSEAGIDKYFWQKVSGPNATINKPYKAQLVAEKLKEGSYVFRLTVTANDGQKTSDEVKVKVNAQEIVNQPPVAQAGPSITIKLPVNTVTIQGKASDPDDGIASYLWQKAEGPAGGSIANPNQAKLVVRDLVEGKYVFKFVVTDKSGASASDHVAVFVEAADAAQDEQRQDQTVQADNEPPTADAGNDITVTLPESEVVLNGSAEDADGSIKSYLWSKISGPDGLIITAQKSTTPQINNLKEGVYALQLKVTDDLGATHTDIVHITVLAADPSLSANITDANCGGENGSIALTIAHGTAPFRIKWSTGETGKKLDDIAPGAYKVQVTDDIGRTVSRSFTVGSVASNLQVDAEIKNATCNQNNGSINIQTTGGTGPYNYEWSTNGRTESLHKLSAGSYSVVVSDQNGCHRKFSFEVGVDPAELKLDITSKVTNASCAGDDGSISLKVPGDNSAYSFVWKHGATGPQISSLGFGNYQVTITDEHGCHMESSYNINQGPGPEKPVIVQIGDSLYVEQAASSYQWFRDSVEIQGADQRLFRISEAGTYSVQIANDKSCQASSDYFYADDPKLWSGQEFTLSQFDFYPNPAFDDLNVRILLNQPAATSIAVYDFMGRELLTRNLGMVASQIFEIVPLNQYPSGTYLIRVKANNEMVTRRFIKL